MRMARKGVTKYFGHSLGILS